LGFAYLLCGDFHGAEDLVQTSLAKMYLRWAKLSRSDFNLAAYVRRMIINENASVWRRAWKRRERSSDVLPEQAFVTSTTDEGTWRLVCALPKQQRAVIALRFYLDVIVAETAELLNCAPGTVKSPTARALAKLKISIQEADELS
jgi:RNA polymerase sigma factor (sigma-70 family)